MNFVKFLKKNWIKTIILFILLTIYIYIITIENIPNTIILFEGENLELNTLFGINISLKDNDYKAVLTSSTLKENAKFQEKGQTNLQVSLFNSFPLKNIEVNVIEKTTVIPIGSLAGIKLYAEGVLVVGMSEIEGNKPYLNSGIEEGDVIKYVDNEEITCVSDLTSSVNKSNGQELKITYLRDGETKECSIKPVKSQEGDYKIGLWVRDSAAGIGTITFYEPETNSFIALGHGITDIDTNQLINISTGELVTTRILSVIKGKNGEPGKIQGTVENQKNIGKIYKNTNFGIYGTITDISTLKIDLNNKMEVALRDEIKTGKATLLCCIDDSGRVQEYEIEIEKIYKNNNYDNKSMLIKITDENLLERTGGIIQGMSGSAIIQNGKFIGALTHVLVNDSSRGYAVFGDMMIKEMKSVD